MLRAILLPFLLLMHGCAARTPLPSMETRAQVHTITVVPAQYHPSSNFVDIASGKLTPLGAGVLFGSSTALAAGMLMTPAAPVVAIGGLLYTMVWTSIPVQDVKPPKETAQNIHQTIADAIVALDASRSLGRDLVEALQKEPTLKHRSIATGGPKTPEERPSYADLRTEGVDAVVEISVPEVGFEICADPLVYPKCPGKKDSPLISLRVKSRARLVRVADGSELYARTFWYESRPRTVNEWAEQGGQPLAHAFELGWRDLAGRIVDELFLVTPLPIPTPGSFATRYNPYAGHCWFRPFYPETSFSKEVGSLDPRLHWESFPRTLDHERLSPAILAKIRDVTYDLKIWETDDLAPGRLIYERTGLPEPSHQVETILDPGRTYFWTFRARFTADGQPMTTPWAFAAFAGSWAHGPRNETGSHKLEVCHSDQKDFHNYYRFTTPKTGEAHAPMEQEHK